MFSWVRKGLRTGILTTRYPAQHELMPPDFRGRPVIDPARCLADQGCTACVDICLPGALRLDQASNGRNETGSAAKQLTLDIGRCIMCGLCISACPADALHMTQEYELAVTHQESLRVVASFVGDAARPAMAEEKEEHNGTSY
jgi:hydrogenase-4 component H